MMLSILQPAFLMRVWLYCWFPQLPIGKKQNK